VNCLRGFRPEDTTQLPDYGSLAGCTPGTPFAISPVLENCPKIGELRNRRPTHMRKAPNRVLLNRRKLIDSKMEREMGFEPATSSLGSLGDVLVLAGDWGEARRRYAASLGIDESASGGEPGERGGAAGCDRELANWARLPGSGSIGSRRWRWRRRSRRRGGGHPWISGCWGC
jgi:hypothetical protein